MKRFWKTGLSLVTAFCMLLSFAACDELPDDKEKPDGADIVTPGGNTGGEQNGGTDNPGGTIPGGNDTQQGGNGTEDNTGDNEQEEVIKHLAYEELPKENGETAYEVVGLGEVEGSEIVIPDTFEDGPVERIGDYAFCAEEKIVESEPVALMILIDSSISMTEELSDGRTKLDAAKKGALAYLNALREKDYCGVGVIEEDYIHLLDPTPMTRKSEITDAINGVQAADNGTYFTSAIQSSCERLSRMENVSARHIVILTDGAPGDGAAQTTQYLATLDAYYSNFGITCSVGGIDILGSPYEQGIASTMTQLTQVGHGDFFYPNVDEFPIACIRDLQKVREDITTELEAEQFEPACKDIQSVTISENVTSIGDGAFAGCENLIEIIFNGTKEQWEAIEKGSCWDYNTGDYVVRCTDGEITKR